MEKLVNHRHALCLALQTGGEGLGIGCMELGGGVPACQALVEMCGEGCRGTERIWDKSGECEKYWDGQ